jgi:hypothetical protein
LSAEFAISANREFVARYRIAETDGARIAAHSRYCAVSLKRRQKKTRLSDTLEIDKALEKAKRKEVPILIEIMHHYPHGISFASLTATRSARWRWKVIGRSPEGGLPAMLGSRADAVSAMRAAKCISTHDSRLK